MKLRTYLGYKDILLAICVALAWGFNGVFTGIAVEVGQSSVMLLIRVLVTSVLLFPFYRKPPKNIKIVLLITLVLTAGHLLTMFTGFRMGLPSSIGILVLQFSIPFLMLLGVLFFKEKSHKLGLLGVGLSLIGIFVLLGEPSIQGYYIAFFIMLFSGLLWAVYSLLVKKYTSDISPMQLITWVSIFSIPVVMLLIDYGIPLIDQQAVTPKHIFSMIYIGVFPSLLGHGIWCYLLSKHPLSQVAPFVLLAPLFGVLGGVLIRGELFTIHILMGGLMILSGLFLNVIKKP